jgi:hypothetical protein
MQFEHDGKTYEVRDITRGERRLIAALYPAAFVMKDGGAAYHGHGLAELCNETMRLSGLKEEALDALTPIQQNNLLLSLANDYAGGLQGKDSGA